ncbi:MAG TPA: Dabb family protein [Bryobacteraceae bacterium]|nr:Dabb family protein [Bryobacteraceae bacterium]
MNRTKILKVSLALAIALGLFSAGVLTGKNTFHQPSSVIHVVSVQWTPESTPEQQKAALDGVKTMAAEIPGIKNVWIKSTRVQPRDYNAAFAIEFENKEAAEAYAKHPAHDAWMKVYEPIHKESRSLQITN